MSGSTARIYALGSLLAISAVLVPVEYVTAEGNGEIIIQRTVQPRVATRPTMTPDPNPLTVNPNVGPQVTGTLNGSLGASELGDADFASVTSGSSINGFILPGGNLPGFAAQQGMINNTLSGSAATHGGGSGPTSGAGISNQVNNALRSGLAPLQMLGGGK